MKNLNQENPPSENNNSEESTRYLLIVDDDYLYQEVLETEFSSLINSRGMQIIKANNGSMAFEIITHNPGIVAVLSDFKMPDMHGIELLENVRKLGLDIPFVILTAYADQNKIIQAFRLGAFDFVEKPFERKDMIAIMESVLDLGLEFKNISQEYEGPHQKLMKLKAKNKVIFNKKFTKAAA